MKRILITGLSGSGKTAVTQELAARGHRAYDLDTPDWSHWVDADPADGATPHEGQDWVWQEDRVRALLSEPGDGLLFVSGCAETMVKLRPLLDIVILLSVPTATMVERMAARAPGGYGSSEDERRRAVGLKDTIEPLLRETADHEIDTRRPVGATVDEILRLVG